MAIQKGLEPSTFRSTGGCSNHLSYWTLASPTSPVPGLEPGGATDGPLTGRLRTCHGRRGADWRTREESNLHLPSKAGAH